MAFVVDGSEWVFDDWSKAEICDALDRILQRVNVARSRGEKVWIGDELQHRKVLGDLSIWEWYISPDADKNLPPELWQELSAWINSAPHYLDEEVWPEGMTETSIVVNDGSPSDNPDLAWAHHNIRAGNHVGCLCLREEGLIKTISVYGSVVIHRINSESGHRNFWREYIQENDSLHILEKFSSNAFPDLFFYAGVWQGAGKLKGGYNAMRHEIRRYLALLDDQGHWTFTYPPPALDPNDMVQPVANTKPSNQLLERRFRGINLVMAPENPNVFADQQCRKEREIVIAGRTLYCEWHGKLQPHQNRIHVHAPVRESGDRVIIGIIDEHLSLP